MLVLPPAGLVLAANKSYQLLRSILPSSSFLQPSVQFAISLRELIHLRLQFSNRHRRNESHFGLQLAILPGTSSLRDSRQEVTTLADNIPLPAS